MNFLRRAVLGSMASLLATTLLTLGLVLSLTLVLSNPEKVKSALSKSGIYASLPRDVVSQENAKKETNSVPLDRPEIQALVEKAFPASVLESDANQIIDGVYKWVKGETSEPEFRVDLGNSKTTLATSIGAYVQQRLASLPACTGASTQAVDTFTTTCRPVGMDPVVAGQQAKQDILTSKGTLENPVLTAETFKNSQGQTLTEQLHKVPELYHNLKLALYGLVGVIVIAALGVIFLSATKRGGLSRAAVICMVMGVVSGAFAWVSHWIVGRVLQNIVTSAPDNLPQAKITEVIRLLSTDVRLYWMVYAAAIALLGLLVWLLLKFVFKQRPVVVTTAPELQLPPSDHKPL